LDAWFAVSALWAQVSPPGAGAVASAPAGGSPATAIMPFRRWYAGLTLSPPVNAAGLDWLWAIALGLAALLVLAVVMQGLGRALRQLFDVPGHVRLFSDAMARLRRSGRVLAAVVGMTVLTWTMGQMFTFSDPQGRDDLTALTKGRWLPGLALEQGALAGATPLRDILALGNMIPMLVIAAMLVFQFSSDRWGSVVRVISPRASRDAAWGTVAWGSAALYAIYRTIGLMYGVPDLPMTGCFGLEVLLVPLLMPVADGILLAWVVVELRNAGLGDSPERERLDVPGAVALMPAAALACVLLMPGRYVATAVALVFLYLTAVPAWAMSYFRWQLGWGVIDLQAAGLLGVGAVGALAWSRGTFGSMLGGYARMLRAEGGHLVGFLVAGGALASGLAAAAYLLVLALPTQTWVLAAADSYAHYATLPVGVLTLAGLVELGERSLPTAAQARAAVAEEVRVVVE
jgi:hypothetical protein